MHYRTEVFSLIISIIVVRILSNFVFRNNGNTMLLQKLKLWKENFLVACRILWAYLGNNVELFNRLTEFLAKLDDKPYVIRIRKYLVIYIQKPDDVQIVLNKFSSMNKSIAYLLIRNLFGQGLITAPVHKWRVQRRALSPAFSTRFLQKFFDIFNRENVLLIDKLRKFCDNEEEFDLWDPLASVSMNIVCETTMGMGSHFEEKDKKEYQEAVAKITQIDFLRICKLWLHPTIIFNFYAKITGYSKYFQQLRKLPLQVIEYKKKLLKNQENSEPAVTSFLDFLLQPNKQGKTFSDQELCDEITTLLAAGSETNALTNCFLLLMLAMNPSIQEKVYKEIIEILGEEDKFIELNDIQQMTYLEMCMKETLRLFSPAPFILRHAKEEFKISDDFTIPARSQIAISPFLIHRNPKIYKDPLVWNPENFSPEEVEKRHKYSFLPFSGGPRGCIGGKYAMLTMKITICMILKHYRVTTNFKMEDINLTADVLIRNVKGYKIKLFSRIKT